MKTIIFSLVYLCLNIYLSSQNSIKAYEYWFNNDISNKVLVINGLNQNLNFNLNTQISTSTLKNGINILNIRFKDSNNKWSSTISEIFYKAPNSNNNNIQITKIQYWFNNNFNNSNFIQLNNQQQVMIDTFINAANINIGINIINFRAQDNRGVYSSTLSYAFYKQAKTNSGQNSEIVELQYWFNNNFDLKYNIQLSNQHYINLDTLLNVDYLKSGINIINFRVKDNKNIYSSTVSYAFQKNPKSNSTLNSEIVEFQYWLNNDFANNSKVSLAGNSYFEINSILNSLNTKSGINIFNFRFKDNKGFYSSIVSQSFYKAPGNSLANNNKIIAFRYWFNNNYNTVHYVESTNAASQFILLDSINIGYIPKGNHVINFQFKDSLNTWSSIIYDTIYKHPLLVADFTYNSTFNCDSSVVNFINLSVDADTYLWNFGNNQTSTTKNPIHVFHNPGLYNISLTAYDSILQKDSTITKQIEIFGKSFANINIYSCETYTSPSGKYTWNSTGIYTDTILNSMNCDSLLNINLTINPTYSTIDSVNICKGQNYTFPDGYILSNIDSNIIHISHLESINFCDSLVETRLTIFEVDTAVVQNANILTALASNANFQWLDCGNNMSEIFGETSNTFTATQNGIYAVRITQNQCVDTSICFTLIGVGYFSSDLQNTFNIFPNPAQDFINIVFAKEIKIDQLKIVDLNGKLLKIFENLKGNEFEINISDLAKGIYIIEINEESEIFKSRIIKH